MHGGHARFSFRPLSVPVPVPPPASAPALEPLSPLSDLSSSPPLSNSLQGARTRLASGSASRPSQRRRDAVEHAAPPIAAPPVRRMRPLACMASKTNANAGAPEPKALGPGKEKAWRADAWRVGGTQHQHVQQILDFPPKHVVLHPEDANNKVFLAIGRALMSVNNCAMTIKDLAELSMQHGIVCQNASAASQAITFFIRSHLHRCEEEQDFPLLLRHVLSGTQKDDALAPALYSRTGGNVSNKDKTARDENGNLKERITCFRRGTTVWYLSRAAGAPCPFARSGIALRDYAEVSSITSVEGRKGDRDSSRGLKRKRERNLRRRAGSGPAARCEEEDDSDDGRKPPKIKLMLRLRPCLTTMREKAEEEEEEEEEESSSSSDSDSDSDVQDEPMDVDAAGRLSAPPPRESSAHNREPTWTFPPFPIQRRISIPPYTPSEETYPTIYTSPTTNLSSSAFFPEWPAKPRLELTCVESPPGPNTPGLGNYYHRERAPSMPFSVASPPPESEDEYGLGDDDDDVSFSMSPEIRLKREEEFAYVWPEAAPSTSSLDLAHVKSEPEFDDDQHEAGSSKRSSTQTIKQEKSEELDLDIGSLSLSFGEASAREPISYDLGIDLKQEDDALTSAGEGFSWGQPVDLTQDESVCDMTLRGEAKDDPALQMLWKDVELLGPDSVRLQDLEDGSWEEGRAPQETDPSSLRSHPRTPLERHDENLQRAATPQSPDLAFSATAFRRSSSPSFTLESLSPPPSLAGSVHTWSVCSPETEVESVGPASPPSFAGPESLAIVSSDEPLSLAHPGRYDIERSSPWMIPGKQTVEPSAPSRQAVAVRSEDVPGIALSEQSAPWERGMCTEEDVEKHLLEPAQPLAMMAIKLPAHAEAPLEGTLAALEPPLSPQEEAVFQSLCMCPDMSWGDEPQVPHMTKQEASKVLDVHAPRMPDTTFADVFAAATRPTMRLRERRPSKRLTELEQVRRQAEVPRVSVANEGIDASADSDVDADFETELALRSRGKGGASTTASGKDGTNGKGPLRRSKRVANAAATQRNRERLRRRTAA